MPWLSHKYHIKERKIVEKGKPKTTKNFSAEAKERRHRKPKKRTGRSRHPGRRKAGKGSVFHA